MDQKVNLLFSIATLLLSVIAIAVSIYTVHKQNKLHLFDKRYDVFCILNFLIAVVRQVIENKNISEQEVLRTSRNAYVEVIAPSERNCNDSDLRPFYQNLCLSVSKIDFLFPKKYTKGCYAFIKTFTQYFSDAIDFKDTEETKKQLTIILNTLDSDKTLETLEKYLNIGR